MHPAEYSVSVCPLSVAINMPSFVVHVYMYLPVTTVVSSLGLQEGGRLSCPLEAAVAASHTQPV